MDRIEYLFLLHRTAGDLRALRDVIDSDINCVRNRGGNVLANWDSARDKIISALEYIDASTYEMRCALMTPEK
jgi:hypothetical protein